MAIDRKEDERTFDEVQRILMGLRERSQFVAAMMFVKKGLRGQDRAHMQIVQGGLLALLAMTEAASAAGAGSTSVEFLGAISEAMSFVDAANYATKDGVTSEHLSDLAYQLLERTIQIRRLSVRHNQGGEAPRNVMLTVTSAGGRMMGMLNVNVPSVSAYTATSLEVLGAEVQKTYAQSLRFRAMLEARIPRLCDVAPGAEGAEETWGTLPVEV